MPRNVDPKKLKRMNHKIEVVVDLREEKGGTDGLVLLLEERMTGHDFDTARQMLEGLCQDIVDDYLNSMEKDGKRASLAAAEAVLNEQRRALGFDEIQWVELSTTGGDGPNANPPMQSRMPAAPSRPAPGETDPEDFPPILDELTKWQK